MRHRYLDLRREAMQRSILLRHKTVKFIRDFLEAEDFIEIETPDSLQNDARGRARFSGAEPLAAGHVLRPAAIAAAAQAIADGRRLRALFSDRALLPR